MCNVGGIDRIVRIIAGLVLLSLVFWIGIVPLATGIFKFCPAYTLLGLKTCAAK